MPLSWGLAYGFTLYWALEREYQRQLAIADDDGMIDRR